MPVQVPQVLQPREQVQGAPGKPLPVPQGQERQEPARRPQVLPVQAPRVGVWQL